MANDDPRDPTEDRVRTSLGAVAGAQPVTDDWPGVLALEGQVLGELQVEPPRANRSRSLLLAAAAIVAVVGLVAVVAFSSRDGRDETVQTIDLAAAAKASQVSTARLEVTEEHEGGATNTFEGEVDFEHGSAHLRGQLGVVEQGLAGIDLDDVPDVLRPMIEVMQGMDEVIVVDGQAYLHAQGTWWDLGLGGAASNERLDLFSAATVLDQVAKLGEVATVGEEEVRGVAATHYRATSDLARSRFDVWVDHDGQVVRVVQTATDPHPGTPTKTTADLFDFGAPVTIEAPAGAQPLTSLPGLEPHPDVDLREVASGTEGAVSWTLSTGELADGRRCVQVSTDPALGGEVVDFSLDGSSSASYDVASGAPTAPSCGPESINGAGSSGATLLTVGGKHDEVHYLAGLLGTGADVTITFADGREQHLDDHDGAFIVTFSGDDWPTVISDANTTCELQGDNTISGTDQVC